MCRAGRDGGFQDGMVFIP